MIVECRDVIDNLVRFDFSDVMKQRCQADNRIARGAVFERHDAVGTHVIDMMAFRTFLPDGKRRIQFRQNFFEKSGVFK